MTDQQHSHSSDMKAAFLGLTLGAIALFVILYGIVKLTNAKYSQPGAQVHSTK